MTNENVDEDDLFESDFASTDEEDADRGDLRTGETAVQDEEILARKVCNTSVFLLCDIGLTISLRLRGPV